MKKLLYISAFPPNQKTGGQTFSKNAINELAQTYLIDLIYFAYPEHECEIEENNNIKTVTKYEIKQFDFIKKIWLHPIFTRRFNKTLVRKIQSIANNYDVLFFDFSQVALYSLYIKHPYKILRMHDVMYQKFIRKNKFVATWVISTEKKIINTFTKVFVPSKKDSELLKKQYNIDSFYTNEYIKPIKLPNFVEQKKQFVFYGYWKRLENTNGLIWFIEEVLPLLKPNIKIIVIGDGLSKKDEEKYLFTHNIEYLGFVDNPLDIILESSAVLVPLFQGAGIKVKVIDSFTVGTPVIGTDLAFEGLPNIQGLLYCTNDKIVFADYVNNLIPLSYEEKLNRAKEFESIYDNHHLLEQI